jgi:urea ABC transporter ATP-binding protein UrtE
MLEVSSLVSGYGKTRVLYGVDFHVGHGERVTILGRNGVGKTTLLRTIMGINRAWEGRIRSDGKELVGLSPYDIARTGFAYVPQGRGLFPHLTVQENLYLGTKARRDRKKQIPDLVFQYFPVLGERLTQVAGTLSGGQQQMLAIGRALAAEPKILLLDEPSEGIQPSLVVELGHLLRRMNTEAGVSILLIEQKLDIGLAVAERCLVMQKGAIVYEGQPSEFTNEATIRRFLAV